MFCTDRPGYFLVMFCLWIVFLLLGGSLGGWFAWFFLEFYPISGLKIPLKFTINTETASVSPMHYKRWSYTSLTLTSDHQVWLFWFLNVSSNIACHILPIQLPKTELLDTLNYKYKILQLLDSSNPYWFQQIPVPTRKELHDHCSY